MCREGIDALKAKAYPPAEHVFVSPMKRCLQTAAILYPDIPVEIVPDLRECDFGIFENRNYAELNGRADYQVWIDSGSVLPFPGGESREAFSARCRKAFSELRGRKKTGDCALIVHGGTVMSIMEAFAQPPAGYCDYQIKNGCGYVLDEDGGYTRIG